MAKKVTAKKPAAKKAARKPPVVAEAKPATEPGRVAIRFMDADERNVIAETTIAAQLREVTLHHEGEPYMASHQDGDIWVYRRTL
jgi:hypothetical protein